METEVKRQIASLDNNPGYKAILKEVVESNRNRALDRLVSATDMNAISEHALELRTWEIVLRELRHAPERYVALLKEEGDPIYG